MQANLILKGGRVIDPASNTDEILDVAVGGSKISGVAKDIKAEGAVTVDCDGLIVTPGLIDLHTHVYWGGTSIGVDPDEHADKSACTTLVDAGTAGPGNFPGFLKHVIEPARVRIVPFLNLSFAGIFAFSETVMLGECTDLELLNAEEALRVAVQHRGLIAGIKVRVGLHASGTMGIEPMEIALEVCEEADLPLMCHLDHPPPSRHSVVSRLRPADILTHCFKPFPNAPARHRDGKIYREIIAARERGVIFDIGHGAGSFSFKTCRAMLEAGFKPDTISSDIHCLSIKGPVFDQLNTLSKFLALGMSLPEVIDCSTRKPADAIRRSDLGRLQANAEADISILRLEGGDFSFQDADNGVIEVSQQLQACAVVQGGDYRRLG
ncbi:MAG: amidohydrolase/deacetylase family metallohydrolase [Gammaproteobacteria bacterium]|nr:amidohydrolase/deacetylase family metallohydrolase [Gammaproteobacteria bacterium]